MSLALRSPVRPGRRVFRPLCSRTPHSLIAAFREPTVQPLKSWPEESWAEGDEKRLSSNYPRWKRRPPLVISTGNPGEERSGEICGVSGPFLEIVFDRAQWDLQLYPSNLGHSQPGQKQTSGIQLEANEIQSFFFLKNHFFNPPSSARGPLPHGNRTQRQNGNQESRSEPRYKEP